MTNFRRYSVLIINGSRSALTLGYACITILGTSNLSYSSFVCQRRFRGAPLLRLAYLYILLDFYSSPLLISCFNPERRTGS